jgi:hypothetical protein
MKLSTTQKVLAVVLGSAIAVAFVLTATVMPVGAAGYVFTRNLTIGSTGGDVMNLQQVLNANANTQVAVSGAGSPGMETSTFGGLTKAALAKFQAGNGISPAAGYFGAITRAFLNNLSGTPVTGNTGSLCPNGMTLASNCSLAPNAQASAALCPNGMTVASNCGAAPTGTVSPSNTDGTLVAAQSSYVSSGIAVKKGETKNVLAVTLKANVGPVTVTRAGVHFSSRPWLLFSQAILKDSTGRVISTKALNSAADATEITVGSDYLVTFDNVNYTVNPGVNADLTVAVSVLPATDKITNGMYVDTAFDTLRTTNGIGWTDTVTAATFPLATAHTAAVGSSAFTLTSTGSVADIYSRVSPNTNPARQVTTSLTQTTSNVVLGTFSLKSANNSSTLNTLVVTLASTTLLSGAHGTSGFGSGFSNVRVFGGGNCTQASPCGGTLAQTSNITAATVTFSNMTIPLVQDAWTDLTIMTDVSASTTGTGITVALANDGAGIIVTDANYGTATYEGGTATSNATTLTVNAVTVTNASAVLGSSVQSIVSGVAVTTGVNATYTFTLNNTSNSDLYVSATTTLLLSTTTTGGDGSSTLATLVSSVYPASQSGDVAGVDYIIQAGNSRTFTIAGLISGTHPAVGVNLKITQINYGTGPATGVNHALPITFGLENLVQSASF